MLKRDQSMNVLLIGSGGREHAIAWKLNQSPLLNHLYIAPGNIGMASLGTLVPLHVEDSTGILAFVQSNAVDLVVIGPEVALAAGVSDGLRAQGIAVFGPSQAAAQIESSKCFSKQFMQRHHIPTARFAVFADYQKACEHLRSMTYPIVIKASGLAAGKGVILPDSLEEGLTTLQEIMVGRQFGEAGEEVVIEERLQGEEVSLLAFCDGQTLSVMPPAQDHKRLLDNDEGPNTGGMGTYAPAHCLTQDQIKNTIKAILQPTVDGLRKEGSPYVGVLYAGLMLTDDGIKTLEFNARFGDPETQVILPLLKSDLLEIFTACTRGTLNETQIQWNKDTAVCVVLASGGYPGKFQTGYPISGLDASLQNGMVFHASTRLDGVRTLNSGGRVLGVTCWNSTLGSAIEDAYSAVSRITFTGMQYRRDIAQKGLRSANKASTYQSAGVDIDAGNRAVYLMKETVQSTYNERVLAGIGSFGGLFDASNLGENPVLVASTDGVGTKVELAARLGRLAGVGEDIVNHCINDILVQGASPLFFLDYFATAKLKPELVAEIVSGMASACRLAGCALLGGETAEMPGVYQNQTFDVAGTIVGLVERKNILPNLSIMQPGDLLLGFASSGPHTNGYSLIRKICRDEDLLVYRQELKSNLADALLAPHRSYLNILKPAISYFKGLSHITGGGFIENIPRSLPENLQPVIDLSSWPVPSIYNWLQAQGEIDLMEMFHVFNMGIGMVAVISPENLPTIRSIIPEPLWVIGELQPGPRAQVLIR
jgi:phosphoribosylamine--glycine ligase/phosphoribosylaminoimidazole synthetase